MLKPVAHLPLPSREPSPFPPSAVDKVNARRSDEDFTPHSWAEIKCVIAENRLEVFQRWPSDVRRYLEWSTQIRSEFGSVQNFVIKNRLRWTLSSKTTTQSGPLFDCVSLTPFQSPADYSILPNDWPYALESGVSKDFCGASLLLACISWIHIGPSLTAQVMHLIVWLKTRLQTEPIKGDMTPTARYQVEDFVQRKFVDRVKDLSEPDDRIQWFKNWTALQSVPGLDHVHVLVRDIPNDIIQEWVHDDDVDKKSEIDNVV